METLTGGALLLFALVGLTFVLRRRSRDGGSRRKPAHTRAAGPGDDPSGGSSMPGTSGAQADTATDGPNARDGERPSWAASAQEPDWPYPDHPSWPAGTTGWPLTPDHPSWPTGGLYRPIGYGRPGGTATGSPAMHHDKYPRPPAPHVPRARGRHVRVPAGYSGYPRPGVPTGDAPQRRSGQLARNAGPIPRTAYDLAFGDGRLQVVLTETPGGDPGRAAAQVAAIREAADREIAELRAIVLAMSDELRRVAEYVTESLTSPGQPTAPPPRRAGPLPLATPVQPDADPSTEPTERPPGKPGAGPGAKRRARPGAESAGKPGTSAKGRQVRAMHKVVAAFVAMSVVGIVAGAAEITLHGFPFFVFRANGAGASLTGLKEDQGPGQPDAPGAHRKVPAATPGATAKAHHPGAKSKGKRSHRTKPQNRQHHGTQHQGTQPSGRQGPKPGKSG